MTTTTITYDILHKNDGYESLANKYHVSFEDVQQVARDITTLIEDVNMSVEEFKVQCASIDQFYS